MPKLPCAENFFGYNMSMYTPTAAKVYKMIKNE